MVNVRILFIGKKGSNAASTNRGTSRHTSLKLQNYAAALCNDEGATLADVREAVATLEETVRVARRVFGGAHPTTSSLENSLRLARAALRARETPSPPPGSA